MNSKGITHHRHLTISVDNSDGMEGRTGALTALPPFLGARSLLEE